jgi:hypothetical protein
VGRDVTLAPDLAADSVSDLLDMFSILPRIDDFPALAELRAAARRCTSTPPTRAWALPASGWHVACRPVWSGNTGTAGAMPACAVARWTCCWC